MRSYNQARTKSPARGRVPWKVERATRLLASEHSRSMRACRLIGQGDTTNQVRQELRACSLKRVTAPRVGTAESPLLWATVKLQDLCSAMRSTVEQPDLCAAKRSALKWPDLDWARGSTVKRPDLSSARGSTVKQPDLGRSRGSTVCQQSSNLAFRTKFTVLINE